ncbi:hypothetical protein OAT07_03865 [Candidatus Pelagibacter sp.]|nr:hypothetical protein [Candidatus Pelagibacter sp.]
MKINKYFLISCLILILFVSTKSFSAEKDKSFDGKGGREDLSFLNAKNSDLKKGKDALKQALKYEKKKKFKKANKKLEKALSYFLSAYKDKPNNVEIINSLGFTYYKVGDYIMTEIYYKEGLSIEPNNISANEGLVKLYIDTKRVDYAKERLQVLSSCNCEEYIDLKKIIDKN